MKILTAQQVKERLNENKEVHLVMTLGPSAFNKCHIPGSKNVWDIKTALKIFAKEDEIIVYCTDQVCLASYYAYQQLEREGYHNIWRFAGGLREWSLSGFPLEAHS